MLFLSKHAKDQARERGISINEIKTTIQKGLKYEQKPDKIVAEYSHIRIVYKQIGENQYVITVMIK